MVGLAVIIVSLTLVALWELCRGRRQRQFPALRRRLGNSSIWLLNILLVAFFLPPQQTLRPQLAALGIGFPVWPISDPLLSFVAGFLVLDFVHYAVHRCEHAVRFLWRFHALHHSDPDLDVTTSLRHHPIEYVGASAVLWLAMLVLNIPLAVAVAEGLAVFVADAVVHGNIRLPEWLERVLQPVVITPDLHRVHHSITYAESNTNYGAVLSIWDRMFGTLVRVPRARQERIQFGLRELPGPQCLKFSAMMLTPWRLPRAGSGVSAAAR